MDGSELPPYLTFAGDAPGPAGFRRGDVYEKILDNLGVALGNEYRFAGDTAHGEMPG